MAESNFSELVWGRAADPNLIGGISQNRLVDLNLIYLIKEKLLPSYGYVSRHTEIIEPGSQTTDPDTGLLITPYVATYNDWVYYNPDPTHPSLTGLLIVPTISTSGSIAWIDYANGTINYSGVQSNSITATYDYYTVLVSDGFPDIESDLDIENLRTPAIFIEFREREDEPFQIGGGYSNNRDFVINITANSDPQRDDLLDMLETSLRYTYSQTVDYKYGFPINFNGTINTEFDRGPASRWEQLAFVNAGSNIIRDPTLPDKLRHQANIMLSVNTTRV